MPPENHAAYLVNPRARPLQVKSAPYTAPGPDEIVVKNGAIAVNPVDYGKQCGGDYLFAWLKYSIVLGSDVAGEVVEAIAVGVDKRSSKPSEGAFQEYTVLRSHLAAKIPDNLSYEKACVLPMGISTASCGLFMKDYAALRYPTSPYEHPSDQAPPAAFIVWGGSTSVGTNAIQLAKAAGYEVLTTASPRTFGYVNELGASQVFDYNDPNTPSAMIAALKNKTCAGAIAIGKGSLEACIDIVAAVPGRKFVAQASVPLDAAKVPGNIVGLVGVVMGYIWWNISRTFRAKIKGVSVKFIWGTDLMANEVGGMIYNDFLPAALASGQYKAKPEPQVVGKGLERIQDALDVNMRGVSAAKVVVTM
ncbi:zinc-binding oxidoreductase CipB [Daldinia vernicosa]|uniref:zinc-binding oxidoreductase CipB n=1 Tax=Daldinia vernicosa TaxID=114800 RepID=UPI00200777CA|nr:zinc-binding oxidoreductase CipB [Daldinia vernicosa]KAI0851732.1 zinc-binding oxidoreductase CipB [Daldinia vernicosa]